MVDNVISTDSLAPFYAPLEEWQRLSGMTRDKIYAALGRGDLVARKDGKRILIDVRHGLTYMNSLPFARIKPRSRPAPDDAPT
jgi:hypothetical protein